MSGPFRRQAQPPIPQVVQDIRARTDDSIRRAAEANAAKRPVDLAHAIVSLAGAAERRRGARADLVDATDTIAAAVRKQLRNGDEVVVARLEATPRPNDKSVDYTAASVGRLVWADGDSQRHPAVLANQDVLLRERAILGLVKATGRYVTEDQVAELREAIRMADEARTNREPYDEVYVEDYECHPATAEEREAFVREAPAVIEAFRDLLEQQTTASTRPPGRRSS
jgi:hypothetical protein